MWFAVRPLAGLSGGVVSMGSQRCWGLLHGRVHYGPLLYYHCKILMDVLDFPGRDEEGQDEYNVPSEAEGHTFIDLITVQGQQ